MVPRAGDSGLVEVWALQGQSSLQVNDALADSRRYGGGAIVHLELRENPLEVLFDFFLQGR